MSTTTKKRSAQVTKQGIVYIKATFNNTIITIANDKGQTIAWSSCGKEHFKGSKKATPFAAQTAARTCAKNLYAQGLEKVNIKVKGAGKGREAAIRGIAEAGIAISEIRDVTPIPHNGCRPPKVRQP